jgi:hypothetical protein
VDFIKSLLTDFGPVVTMGVVLFMAMGWAVKYLAGRLEKKDDQYIDILKEDLTAKQAVAASLNALDSSVKTLIIEMQRMREDLRK